MGARKHELNRLIKSKSNVHVDHNFFRLHRLRFVNLIVRFMTPMPMLGVVDSVPDDAASGKDVHLVDRMTDE